MRMTVFEGTVEEIRSMAEHLGIADEESYLVAGPAKADDDAREVAEVRFPTTGFARAVLTRRPLGERHLKMLRTLHSRNENYTYATKIMGKLKISSAQFRGVMGAFGRRLQHTPGYEDGIWFFDQEWDDARAEYRYRLPPAVREALELEGLIKSS